MRPSRRHRSLRRPATSTRALVRLLAALALLPLGAVVLSGPLLAAGPPFPDPTPGVRVYDEAGIFSQATVSAAEATIKQIEDRSHAQVVVYSQLVENGRTTEEADQDALALMNQWGVGRKGFDDGLVILFDIYPGAEHGQVILYGGDGFRATFLDNGEKQKIFDEDMRPRLKQGDFDGALTVALQRVDAATTPEHAARLERARQIDAVAGLLVAPMLVIGLVLLVGRAWLRYGRDPVYLDDPSIHMAGPPESLTPAAAAFVLAGQPTRRALTAALLDLASRGEIRFVEEHSGLLGHTKKVGIQIQPAAADPTETARRHRNRARSLGPAERSALKALKGLGLSHGQYVGPATLLGFSSHVAAFDQALEETVVERGWYAEKPSVTRARWLRRAIGIGSVGGIAWYLGVNIPTNGLLFIGIALVIGAGAVGLIGRVMPAVTLPGAMIRAMLAAYRRTLKKTMDQARSMDQVVAEAGLPWLETPDQAVVWATALGLHQEIEAVLGRSLDDERHGRVAPGGVWMPAWYGTIGSGSSGFVSGDFAGATSGGGSIFSGSAVPNIGGMMATLGSIGNAASSGGSGFGGGGGGGGGGGSGGGF